MLPDERLGHSESGLKADIYLAGRNGVDAWAFRHAREYSIGGLRVRLAPPEYVIVRKLEFYREAGSHRRQPAVHELRAELARLAGDEPGG